MRGRNDHVSCEGEKDAEDDSSGDSTTAGDFLSVCTCTHVRAGVCLARACVCVCVCVCKKPNSLALQLAVLKLGP